VRRAAGVLLALLFLVLAALVAHGTFTSLDQYAVDHWMPWRNGKNQPLVTFTALVVPDTRHTLGGTLVCLWTYPAAVLPSALIVTALAWFRRVLFAPVLWIVANALELAGKLIVYRPALYAHGVHLAPFDNSLPSGHTLRAFVVAAALAAAFRYGRVAYVWALTMPVALVLIGAHVPTDAVAGLLAFGALAAGGRVSPRGGGKRDHSWIGGRSSE
jgi:membrane-associated phospholipid phosphatase